jgi:DNA polymerase III epsilon subunit-like protein
MGIFSRHKIKKEPINHQKLDDNIVVLDFETTGFPPNGEILQVALIDGHGNKLISELCKPEHTTHWEQAEKVHGISPNKVVGCKTFREQCLPKLKNYLDNAKYIIAYNARFEKSMLELYNIDTSNYIFADPMLMFAEVYGEYNEYYGNYKWKKLSVAADYYNYDFTAHDALEDVKATLFIFKKMLDAGTKTITI